MIEGSGVIGAAFAAVFTMSEESEQLKRRTMKFALDVCGLIKQLPYEEPGTTIRRQLAKAATSVAFNYRASCRARSHDEFTAKIGLVAEESDESQGWLEFIDAARLMEMRRTPIVIELKRLLGESGELVAIFSASFATAKQKQRARRGQ